MMKLRLPLGMLPVIITIVLSLTGCPPTVSVPNVVGMTQAAAQTSITDAGLKVGTVTEAFSDAMAAGHVISQDPAAGAVADKGSSVNLVVSKGPEVTLVSVPNVVGMAQAAAQAAITNAGLVPGSVAEVFSDAVPQGGVISEDPAAGTSVAAGSAVNLVVSKGPQSAPGTVPDVVGMTQFAAQTAITSVGLAVGAVTEEFNGTVPAGQVISQDPAAGTSVAAGSAVDLVLSKGPEPVYGTEETIMLPGNVPLVMVIIPAGSFMMGRHANEQNSYDWESPQHEVSIAQAFALGKYKVTQEQWQALMGDNPSFFSGVSNRPVDTVSWNDAQAFITALNALGHGVFRLPSEAEWEFACRAGTTTRFFWGDDLQFTELPDHVWFTRNSASVTHPVGQKTVNPWGLYDMGGDVWEWCQDWWHDDYTGAPTDGSAWESPAGSGRVGRGGAWNSFAEYCRAAYRSWDYPENSADNIGFRLAR